MYFICLHQIKANQIHIHIRTFALNQYSFAQYSKDQKKNKKKPYADELMAHIQYESMLVHKCAKTSLNLFHNNSSGFISIQIQIPIHNLYIYYSYMGMMSKPNKIASIQFALLGAHTFHLTQRDATVTQIAVIVINSRGKFERCWTNRKPQ